MSSVFEFFIGAAPRGGNIFQDFVALFCLLVRRLIIENFVEIGSFLAANPTVFEKFGLQEGVAYFRLYFAYCSFPS